MLEALSYGVPVIVSDNVGAKDIVENCGLIVKAGDRESLKNAILSLNATKIEELTQNIFSSKKIKQWDDFAKEIDSVYNQIIKNNTSIS